MRVLGKRARGSVVLTPHPGEASRLLGVSTTAINDDCVTAALTLAERTGATVLIKGARSIIASPDGEIFRRLDRESPGCPRPESATRYLGVVAARCSGQRMRPPRRPRALGVFLHGYAADRVAARMGRVSATSRAT